MNDISTALQTLSRQEQFLDVVDRDEAYRRFHRHLDLVPLGKEAVGLSRALGRILAQTVAAGVDVPGFDRSSVDGFAVCADDTVGASDRAPRTLTLNSEILTPGTEPQIPVTLGTATLIERMEKEGLIGAANHAGKREILVGNNEAVSPY